MEREVQEQILKAEHQRSDRIDLDRARPLPEVVDRDARSRWRPVCRITRAENVMTDVKQRETLRAQRRDTGRRVSQAAEDRLDPGQIAAMHQQVDVTRRP